MGIGDRLANRLRREFCGASGELLGRKLFTPAYGGCGVFFTLHRVVPQGTRTLAPDLAFPIDLVEAAILYVRDVGWEIVSPGGMKQCFARGQTDRRFVCFTFDDGYADNYTLALPVFQKHKAPLTVYISTGFLDRTAFCWWGALEEMVLARDRVEFPVPSAWLAEAPPRASLRACANAGALRQRPNPDSRGPFTEVVFGTAEPAQKLAVYNCLQDVGHAIDTVDSSFFDIMDGAIRKNGTNPQAVLDRAALRPDQARELAADPLVTIGAHGISHRRLSLLRPEELQCEVAGSRRILEDRLNVAVRHFAYPYGGADACGEREFGTVAALGFETGVTTRQGNIFPEHLGRSECLPRRNFLSTLRGIADGLSGATSFIAGTPRVVHVS